MFQKGEYVVYGSKGVCQIRDIAHVDIPGVDQNRLYYIMSQFPDEAGTVYLPTDSNKAVIRRVMTADEARRLLDDIPRIEELSVTDERKREETYKDAMRTCSSRAWISVIKSLYFRRCERLEAGKKITALDERYLKAAEHELYGELSVALDTPVEKMEEYVRDCLKRARSAADA